jgi:prepilin-type N-terminal cleavage/methylation domain-containing protein
MKAARGHGFTLFESLIALALFVLLGFFIYELFGALFPRDGPMSLNIATSRSLVLQQSRQAIRKLFYRVQEGIQLIAPAPGGTARELVFRDIRNRTVRLRHLVPEKRVVCELLQDDTWVPERSVESTNARPIQIDACESALFTALSPATVCVNFTTSDDRVRESYMTVITLSNTRLDR